MKASSSEQDAWPVQLFRHSVEKGWEMVDKDIDSDPVMAAPCAGGIEIRMFRVRIRLFPKDANDTDWSYGYASRRVDRIYCPSRSSSGGLVLKFRNKQDCLEFFDRLIALNPSNESNNGTTESLNTNGDQNGGEIGKRKGLALSLYGDDVAVKRRKFDTMSYIVRLLHDEDFRKFVDDIEQTLTSSPDGASILDAIKRTGPPAENPPVAQVNENE